MSHKLLSIVIPTRDRPEMVYQTLKSLSLQDDSRFEVIVSDNYKEKPCRDVFDGFEGPNFQYVRPHTALPMCDHWEFALSHAQGEYVAYIMDKQMVYTRTVNQLCDICEAEAPDIISWIPDATFKVNEESDLVVFRGPMKTRDPELFDPRAELRRRRQHIYDPFDDGYPGWFRGKIVSGAYSRKLISKIQKRHTRVFLPISPDQTSLALGLDNADVCVDLCRPMVQLLSMKGNGKVMKEIPGKYLEFVAENWPEMRFELMPIKGLYAGITNWNAYDSYANKGRDCEISYDDLNLILLAEETAKDLSVYPWSDEAEERSQRAMFGEFLQLHGIDVASARNSHRSSSIRKGRHFVREVGERLHSLSTVRAMYWFVKYKLWRSGWLGTRMEVFQALDRSSSF